MVHDQLLDAEHVDRFKLVDSAGIRLVFRMRSASSLRQYVAAGGARAGDV